MSFFILFRAVGPSVCLWGELAADGEKRGKERAKGSSDGCGGRSQLSALPYGEGSGGVQGGNQFRIVCAGRLGRLFNKPRVCDLIKRRLFDKHRACNLADRFLLDKPQTCDLADRRLFNKHRTCALVDRRLFDKPQTCDLIDRCLFACGEAARSVSRGLFDSRHQRASWATSRMARHRSPLWGRGRLLGKDKAERISIPFRADLRA